MADRQALRDLQHRLAEQLQLARTQQQGPAWLAVEAAGHGLLLPLQEAGEIFALPPMVVVPHTRSWFRGVANLRGHLHGVADLAGFLGLVPVGAAGGAGDALAQSPWLVAFNTDSGLNCALQVDRLAGLRRGHQLQAEPEAAPDSGPASRPRPAFAGQRLRDEAGRLWQEIRLAALARDPGFLDIVGAASQRLLPLPMPAVSRPTEP